MSDLATLQAWLSEAETARHKLLSGSLRQRVSYNGQDVTFAATDIGKLNAYISDLQARIAALNGDPRKTLRPIHFSF